MIGSEVKMRQEVGADNSLFNVCDCVCVSESLFTNLNCLCGFAETFDGGAVGGLETDAICSTSSLRCCRRNNGYNRASVDEPLGIGKSIDNVK